MQAFQDINNGDAKWVTTDLFDTDSDDKIIEHWDVIAAFETKPDTEVDQISGPTEVTTPGATEDNKEIVRNFICDVMILGQEEKFASFVDRDALITHASSEVEPLENYQGAYDQIVRIIGQGNTVVAYSRVIYKEQEIARFDIFRVEDGKIVEVWVNQEPVPPKSEWVNGGKF